MDELEKFKIEEEQMMKSLKLMEHLFCMISRRNSKTRASAYDNLTYLLQEIVWLQSAKKEIPEQVEEFFERINTNKVRVEVKEEESLYKQMTIPGLEKIMQQSSKKKRKVSVEMFEETGCFIKYPCKMTFNNSLMLHDKKALTDLCRYMGFSVSRSANQKSIADSLSNYVCEYPTKLFPALSCSIIRTLMKFVRLKEQETVNIDENTIDDYMLLMYIGILSVEIISQKGKLYFAIGIPKEVEQNVIPVISKLENEGISGEKIADYLDASQVYTLEPLYQSYDEMMDKIRKILTLYGVMYEEELYQMFMSLTQMECSKEDFLRFIYLKGTFRQELRSGQNRFTKQKVVGFDEGIMERYLSYLEQNPIPVERSCKYENFKQLEQELNVAIERWQDIQYVMEQWKLPPEKLDAYMTEWYMLVSGGENSSRIFNEMMCEFDIEETVDIACLWRALMLICLQQPCYLLKGYSRLHAEKKCGLERYYNMFEVEPTKTTVAKLIIYELPEPFQKQLADMVLLSQEGKLTELIEAEKKVEEKYRANQIVNTVLTMNMVDVYVHLSSKEQQKKWKKEVEQRVQRWCDEIKNEEERHLMLSWCYNVGFPLRYEQKFVSNTKNTKSIEDVVESYFWEDRRQEIIPVVKDAKIYPNDPCPCGSGKKYKKCCGKKK